jgi:hypothetical protein
MNVDSQSTLSIRDVTWDNYPRAEPNNSKGFVHFDNSDGGPTAHVMCHFDTVHTETNADELETNASGLTAADKRGIIACTIDPTEGNVQFHLTLTNFQIQGWNSTNTSHSLIQMLGGDGATEADKAIQRSARLNVNGRNIRGVAGDGTATLGSVIPIGGIPTAHKSTFTGGTYNELIHAPTSGSDVFGSERPRRWSYTS